MTLVESLVAMSILGIAVVGLLSGVVFLITATTRHRAIAEANTLAVRAAEIVADPLQTPFKSCATAQADYQTSARDAVIATVTVDAVKVWSAGTWVACPAAPTLPLQKITVTAPSPDGGSQVTLEVVKRDEP